MTYIPTINDLRGKRLEAHKDAASEGLAEAREGFTVLHAREHDRYDSPDVMTGPRLRSSFVRHLDTLDSPRLGPEAAWLRLVQERPYTARVFEDFVASGRSTEALAAQEGVSERTIQRWVQRSMRDLAAWTAAPTGVPTEVIEYLTGEDDHG